MTNGTEMEVCYQELELLKSIDKGIKALLFSQPFQDTIDGWTRKQVGKSFFYEITVTYTGAAQTIVLNFPKPLQLNRIEQIWNDVTPRDYSIQMFTNPAVISYIELRNEVNNIALNMFIQAGNEYKYPGASCLKIYYVNTTAAKTCTVRVQCDEL